MIGGSSSTPLMAMMVKGEGGEMDVNGGRALWEAAAAKGDTDSQTNLDRLKAVLSRVALVM